MKKPEPRFDVVYGADHAFIESHFCREWDGDTGCYGTNPDHGFSFEEAKQHLIEHYQKHIKYWQEMTLEKWESDHLGHTHEDDEDENLEDWDGGDT